MPSVEGMNAGNSHIGVRGKEDLGGGLKAEFQIEGTVAVDDGNKDGFSWNRNGFVGLEGAFGEIRLGIMDTVLKDYGDTLGILSVSSGTPMSSSNIFRKPGFGTSSAARFHERRPNSVRYDSFDIAGFAGALQVATNENETPDIGPQATFSMGLQYDQKGPVYVGVAYEIHNNYFGGSAQSPAAYRNNGAGTTVTSRDTAIQVAVEWRASKKHRFELDWIRKRYKEDPLATATGKFQSYVNDAFLLAMDNRWSPQWRTAAHYVRSLPGSCSRVNAVCTTDGLLGQKFEIGASYYLKRTTFLFVTADMIKNDKSARFSNNEFGVTQPGEDTRHVIAGNLQGLLMSRGASPHTTAARPPGLQRRRLVVAGVAGAGMLLARSASAQDMAARNRAVFGYQGADREARLLEGAKREGQVSIYTSLNTKDSGPITEAFEKQYGVKPLLWRASSEKVLQRAVTEASAGRHACDVLETNGPEMEAMYREKLLEPFYSPHFKDLPPAAFPKHRHYVADRFNFFTIGYNTNLVKPEDVPGSYADLLLPRFAGRIGIEAGDTDWFAAMVKSMGEDKGLAFFRKLAASKPQMRTGHTLMAELVSSGEIPLAATIYNHNIERLKVKGAPVEWKALTPTFGRPNAIGVAARSANPHAALLFTDFMLSPQGQTLLKQRNRVPASTAVDTNLNKFPFEMIDPVITLDEADKWDKLWSALFLGGQQVRKEKEQETK